MTELATITLFTELRTLISEVSSCEAQVQDFTTKLDDEAIKSSELKKENDVLQVEKAEKEAQVTSWQANKATKQSDINATTEKRNEVDNKIKNFDSILEALMKRSEELLVASEVSQEIQDALTALDRRQLSEISKLGSPPSTVKQALEILMVFLDVFGQQKDDHRGSAASGGGAEEKQKKSSGSKSSASKTTGAATDDNNSKFKKERPWAEIRKFMAIDIRPQIVHLTPEILSEDGEAVDKLRKMMSTMDSAKISKASKPTGILYDWCKAILECAFSIRERKETELKIENLKKEFPTLQSEFNALEDQLQDETAELATIESQLNEKDDNLTSTNEKLDNLKTKMDESEEIVKEISENLEEVKQRLSERKKDLKKLSDQARDQLGEIENQKQISIKKLDELNGVLSPLVGEYDKLKACLASLKKQEVELRESSKLPPKVVEKLQTLDRRALSEITRMSAPPKIIQTCLEIIFIFLEVFLTEEMNAALPGAAAAATAAAEYHSTAHSSPQKKSKFCAATFQPGKSKLPHADWPEIRKLLAVDLRPKLIAITPEVVADEQNTFVVAAIKNKMSHIETKAIEKASKPSGLLWLWCSALVVCDESIKLLREVSAKIKQEMVKEQPLLDQISKLKLEIHQEESKITLYNEILESSKMTHN